MGREIDGKLRVANDSWGDFRFSVATDKIAGISQREVYGFNPDINGTLELVWGTGGNFPYPTSAQTIYIVSTSADDDSAGTGIREVRVEYLNSSFETIFVDVELDGTNPVQIGTDFFRVQDVRALQVGSVGSAVGTVTLYYGVSTTIATIFIGTNEARSCLFTIPAGYTGYITGASISASKGGDLAFQLEYRDNSVANAPFVTGNQLDIYEQGIYFDLPTYYVVPERYDIRVRAYSLQSSNISASCTYHLILRNNRIYANN